ncbi:hypothetical protein MD484_g7110, partial [Candolleomyces efflorescens]
MPPLLHFLLAFAFQVLIVSGSSLFHRDNDAARAFVTTSNGTFQLNGKYFRFYGTNAYWAHMTTDEEMDRIFHDIATIGIRIVRTWAFNDVSCKPKSGPYFQILKNGDATINEGVDGLQRLDKLVATADKYGIKLILTLTNNWNPDRPMPDSAAWSRRESSQELPRGYLANDYGGIDAYVRAFRPEGTHDLFYTDPTIIQAFSNYVRAIVTRYSQNPAVMAFELGNDLRCSSTLKGSSNCNPQIITRWAAEISKCIKEIDHKHLVTVGDSGFYCLDCPKLYANTSTRRQPALEGPSFDGSYGIDTDDLLAIPTIDFGSLQIAPEQIQLFPVLNDVDFATQAIGDGGKWIEIHSQTSIIHRKPEVVLQSGIVSQRDWDLFVPNDQVAPKHEQKEVPCRGVEDFQVDYSLTFWASAALNGNVDGVLESNWVQSLMRNRTTPLLRGSKRPWEKRVDLDWWKQHGGPPTAQNIKQFSADSLPINP